MYRRHVDSSVISARDARSKAAKILAPNIAPMPAPPTSELMEHHISRKRMKEGEI